MDHASERRSELGGFLRARRRQLVRDDYALPPVRRSRTTGLRREEVAYHAGVSVTWYTWLEQGRDINPSRQVLDAVAHTMRLSAEEHRYVLALAGFAPRPSDEPAPAEAPAHLQRLLDELGGSPAFAVAADWSIAAWNRSYELLYPGVADLPVRDRNLLLVVFTDPGVRRMLPDWESTSRRFLAEYRAEAGPSLGQAAHTSLIDRLQQRSPEFARAWEEHAVERFESRQRRFVHPVLGELVFEHHRLDPADVPELHVIVYTPADEPTRRRMAELERRRPGRH